MKKIQVPRDSQEIFKKNWKLCVGTGRLGLALQKEYLEHLKMVKEEIGFEYIRGHGLFHEDIGIYQEIEVNGEMKPFYNFTYIDRIFDSFLELGIRPFVEVGFMPKLLASDNQTIFYWKGNVTPPKDYEKWKNLVEAVVIHFIDRYGIEEVLKWPFEIWNEPNLVNFWKDANKEEYFKLYKLTAETIKSVHPDIKVGGPAICGGSDDWIVDFLDFCKKEKAPVDFVTRHAYTSKKPNKITFDYYYQELADNTQMLDEFKTVRQLINQSPFPHLPFHITEYNTSYSPINPVHDTVLNASYLARILSEGGDYVDSFSYWTFSDVFEEAGVPKAQFHGGFGLIALNGIPKPTFHLFSFFNQLGEVLLYRDERTIVTKRKDGSVALIAWNLITEKGSGYETTLNYEIPLSGEKIFVKRQVVNETYGNPFKTWKQMGRPRFPGKKMVETLKEVAKPYIETSAIQPEKGKVSYRITLAKNEVTLVEFTQVRDETETYPGLDDSLITSYE